MTQYCTTRWGAVLKIKAIQGSVAKVVNAYGGIERDLHILTDEMVCTWRPREIKVEKELDGIYEKDGFKKLILPNNWLTDFQTGKELAFRFFYDNTVNILTGYLGKTYPCEKMKREDIVAEAYIFIFNQKHRLKSFNYARGSLFKRAISMCIDRYRHEKVIRRKEKELERLYEELDLPIKEDEDLDEFLIELKDKIKDELVKLPKRMRQVIELMFYTGLDKFQISDKLGISPQTVLNLKTLAIDKLVMMCRGKERVKRGNLTNE